MEYLRWILLLVGVAVLAAVYFVSRQRSSAARESEPFYDDEGLDPLDSAAPSRSAESQPSGPDISESDARSHVLSNLSHELETLNHLLGRKPPAEAEAENPAVDDVIEEAVEPSFPEAPTFDQSTFLSEPVLGDLFEDDQAPGQETETHIGEQAAEKIITLHICARAEEHIEGSELLRVFESRGYEFGEMDIFHSRVDGVTVFSIVNMVEPGWFHPETMDGFFTPGISLFLQLPGPLAADVAFDVLVNEARELANALNAQLLDASRSTFTLQVEQHLREELKQFQFQKKSSAPGAHL